MRLSRSSWAEARRRSARVGLGVASPCHPRRAAGPRAEGASGERFVLAIPARTAFGVGSHESTRLAYELLESTPLAGKRVLDVGCGSGILAMAALLLGARAAVGFDFDPAAGLLAGQYARHNGLAPAIFTGTVAALAAPASADSAFEVVVLNVLPHEIAGRARPGDRPARPRRRPPGLRRPRDRGRSRDAGDRALRLRRRRRDPGRRMGRPSVHQAPGTRRG